MTIKTIYRYDKTTKEYLGEAIANESPVRPGTYFIQPYTTDLAPPETREYEVAVFETETQVWSIKTDCRGKVYYDTETKERHVITEIGDLPDTGWTNIEPTDTAEIWNGQAWKIPFEVLKDRKAAEIRAISAAKVAAIQDGYTLGEVHTFEQQYNGACEILASGVADDITTMSKDAQFVVSLALGRSAVGGVVVTPEELAAKIVSNYQAAKEYTVAVLSVQQGLETLARMAVSLEELDAIKWPETV